MKYLILIYANRRPGRSGWACPTRSGCRAWTPTPALDADLLVSGELIVSEALADSSGARRVTVQDGQLMTTDAVRRGEGAVGRLRPGRLRQHRPRRRDRRPDSRGAGP